ncbi:MAG: helix-turn-helix domain-containing protein [Patescibacteria group bacterium]|nr:helix-turn-helix domain-containing protein [Patescibacteria group bacterium]
MKTERQIPNVPMLGPERIAWVLGVSERTARQWLADGEISHFRLGHVVRSTPEEVLSFILGHTRRAKAAPAESLGAWRELAAEDWARIERLIVAAVEEFAKKEAA